MKLSSDSEKLTQIAREMPVISTRLESIEELVATIAKAVNAKTTTEEKPVETAKPKRPIRLL